jgi:chromosome segregation ATPase
VEAITQADAELSKRNEQLATLRRNADRLHDQLEMLQRLKDEGEGYSGGARAILRSRSRWLAQTSLPGIVGTVADQIQVTGPSWSWPSRPPWAAGCKTSSSNAGSTPSKPSTG